MPAKHDPLALLSTPVTQALLYSTISARLAYTGRDGTPRVLPSNYPAPLSASA